MIVLIAMLTWLAYCYLAYVIFVDAWTRDFNYDTSDRVPMVFFAAFGPFSFLAAIFVWITTPKGKKPVRIITPKKD